MFHMIQSRLSVALALLTIVIMVASAQTQRQSETFSIQGYTGRANIIRSQGRALVDAQDLARITKGGLSFEGNRIILTLPRREQAVNDAGEAGFSPAFRKAAIEAMAQIREWGGMLQVIVQNGYPVGKAMVGNTVRAYQGRAADSIALAAAAASTDSDQRGVELLKNEFNNLQAWAQSFVDARNSMRAVELTTSENPLDNDPDAQKIISCGQFLAQMFGGGAFQDDAACH
jgi:hypothetical protein